MICIKEHDSNSFVVGSTYTIEGSDTFGIYVIGDDGVIVYFDDEEELQEYFTY